VEAIIRRLTDLKPQLNAIRNARDNAISEGERLKQEADAAHKANLERLAADLAARIEQRTNERTALSSQKEARRKKQTARTEKAWLRMKAASDKQTLAAVAKIEAEQKEKHAKGAKKYDEKMAAVKAEGARIIARIESLQAKANELHTRIEALNTARSLGLDFKGARAKAELAARNAKMNLDDCEQQLVQSEAALETRALSQSRGRSAWPITFILTAAAAAAGFWIFTTMPGSPILYYIGGGWILLLGIVWTIYQSVRERLASAAGSVLQDASLVRTLLELYLSGTQESLATETKELENAEIQRICGIDETFSERVKDARKSGAQEQATLRTRRDGIVLKITKRSKGEQAEIQSAADRDIITFQKQHEKKVAEATAANAAAKNKIEQDTKGAIARHAGEFKQALENFVAYADGEKKKAAEQAPLARGLADGTLTLTADFPTEIYLSSGTLRLQEHFSGDDEGPFSVPDLQCAVPLGLNYPNLGSMYIRASGAKRDASLAMLLNAAMRLLCGFPAGKAKLTIIDPVGVGQSFGAFMHLTDYDETLVNGKVWSDGAHIERKLSELTEHIEKVTQKYLRNRYETVSEFNKEAGQMSVPYQFVVISDFPTALSELALERLSTIINSGPRCGVYTLMYHNSAQKMPATISELQLKKNGLFLIENGDAVTVNGTWTLSNAWNDISLPGNEAINALMSCVGKQCQEAARVQVPFEVAAPKPGDYWNASTEGSIRMPLGMAGADRLQYLQLGTGTSQHALIAGKTGSGKSNLFHVIVSNAALWYSPKELEFYLIDFKKGVEFKTYGDHQLPHARVIAIESDREFGLSVLRRIDKELSTRGELFRHARVQDFPSYRKSAPQQPLPRTLLMIDEFQEFFTDDDSVAQEAALYLDRIVRQGRAFGIHVILGTQTLGGTYSLAKSTLGQIAVRIALQCNEADSYLVLNDDNGAAALLTRPGEAIYNDMAGFVEGNSPFQAVFLPRQAQDVCLTRVTEQAKQTAYKPLTPPIVFEGNALSDLRNNPELREFAEKPSQERTTPPRVWLGEANAIKGPTQAEFSTQAGSNLLFVGQRGYAAASATLISLLASHPLNDIKILVLDGSNGDPGLSERLALLQQLWPDQIEVVAHRSIQQRIGDLAATVAARQGGEAPAPKTFLLVIGIERFRALRQDDEFASFSSSSEEGEGASAAANFGKLLSDGPNEGIHSIVWCDTLANLNRTFSRKMIREFEMRVLYQVSANDSSELIDSPVANRLGLYSALLFTAFNGAVEKFRPYGEPDLTFLKEVYTLMQRRQTLPDKPVAPPVFPTRDLK